MPVNISKQIIDQKVIRIMNDNPDYFSNDDEERRKSKCFLLLGVSAYLDRDLSEAMSYITDGGNDGGFDAAFIEEAHDGQINVVLFQSKYTRDLNKDACFPSNAVEKAVNAVSTIFDPASRTLLNESSRRKADEIRSLILDGFIPYVTFVMLNNGEKWNDAAQLCIDNAFGDQEQVRFVHFGTQDILGYIRKKDPIDTSLNMAGLSIQENFNFKRVIIGKVRITEIVRMMEEYGDLLLEKNIRKYLGKNEINDSIADCLKSGHGANFFFYNNGITMICDKFSYNALQEKDWIVKLRGLQIINGGQTCRALHQTVSENRDLAVDDAYVLVRIYEVSAEDEKIVKEITYATNHQNPVDLRDLKSNDPAQQLLEHSAMELGYVYKRKRDSSVASNAIPSTVAAEAVLSVWRKSPHLARYKKSEMFGAFYRTIFDNLNAAQMIIAVMVFRHCDAVRKRATDDRDIMAMRFYDNYFLSCMVGTKLLYDLNLDLDGLTHISFGSVRDRFSAEKDSLAAWAEEKLKNVLREYFNLGEGRSIAEIDGRTMAAAFRRFDIVEKCLRNQQWWNDNLS
ncbi:MAG: AIPR family protein [Succinivibrionaceae bacterium]|nr:AIPR family protein [Succinivibrionaceae bacterium]